MKKASLNLCRNCHKTLNRPWGEFQQRASTGQWQDMKPFVWCPDLHVSEYAKSIHTILVDYMAEFFPEAVVLGVEIPPLEVNFNYATFGEEVPLWCPHKEVCNESTGC